MSERILLVDDDPNLLAACRRNLRGKFDITTAEGAQQALDLLDPAEPFAVILADMRMPGIDGVQLLAKVKDIAPDTVRMMLTGNADLESAAQAVNEGQIFRFLTKPCPPELLVKSLAAGLKQHRLITAEKQLLEQTLRGSVQVLTDIISIIKPKAFGRASRIRRCVLQVVDKLGLERRWQYEIAAMLSQLGCVSMPDEILGKFYAGVELDENEQRVYGQHPGVACELIGKIPRLHNVARMIQKQTSDDPIADPATLDGDERDVAWGALILRAALDLDQLVVHGMKPQLALGILKEDAERYHPTVIEALVSIDVAMPEFASWAVDVQDLRIGMIFDEDVHAINGALLVTKGQEVSETILKSIQRRAEAGSVKGQVRVLIPNTENEKAPQTT
jgi:response regulator RpfG family c-di-GMP phosphodiesterase